MQSVLKKVHKESHSSLERECNQPGIRPSDCALRTTNPIRNIVDRLQLPAEHLRNKKLLSLALGDPTAYLDPPTELIEAVQRKLMDSQHSSISAFGYPPATGYDAAKTAIATRANEYNHKLLQELESKDMLSAPQHYVKEDVILASGCSGALDLAIKVLCSAADTILIPRPGFSLYRTIATSLDLDVHEYKLIPERSWEVDLEDLERFLKSSKKRTSAWIVNNPSNPCGSVYSLKHLASISKLALKYNIPLISDEIYEDMTFTPHAYIPMSIVHKGPLLTCSGLAKRFLVPGWRVGWILIQDQRGEEGKGEMMQQVRKGLVDLAGLILGPNSLIQASVSDIFVNVPAKFYENINTYLHNNSLLCTRILSEIPGLRAIPPQGTLYLLVSILSEHFPSFKDDVEFCQALLNEEMVSCLPGSIFGADGFIRIVFAAPEDVLKEALVRLKSFAERHFRV